MISIGAIITVFILLIFIAVYALAAVYAERKVSAFIQNRVGPNETGPFGLFQTAADIIKLLLKEKIIPTASDKALFVIAPLLIFISVFAGFAVIPFGPGFIGSKMNVGVLFLIAIVSVHVIGLMMAGMGSNNKYALLGSLRSMSQILSYEIPSGLALLCGIAMFGTLNLYDLSMAQGTEAEQVMLFGLVDVTGWGGILSWGILRYPHLLFAWGIYFIASLAECNRAPFDIPEAESELVSGYHVEYSGFRFAMIFLSEYANMFLVGLLAAVVFLGGWYSPLPNIIVGGENVLPLADWTNGIAGEISGAVWGAFWILAKALTTVFVHIWIRWTLPRFRVDQLTKLSWKILTPIAFLLLVISAVWRLVEVYSHLS